MAELPETPQVNIRRPSEFTAEIIDEQRTEIADLMSADAPSRLITVVGACSLSGEVYCNGGSRDVKLARKLAAETVGLANIYPVLRAVSGKPRSTHGWRGLAHEYQGIYRASEVARQINFHTGDALAGELLGSEDFEAIENEWGGLSWIGARDNNTATRSLARPIISRNGEKVNRAPTPVFLKNGTKGELTLVRQAMDTIRHPDPQERNRFTVDGIAHEITGPNPHVGVLWRGKEKPSARERDRPRVTLRDQLRRVRDELGEGVPIGVDASHGNSRLFDRHEGNKGPEAQMRCLDVITELVLNDQIDIRMVMIEADLRSGADPSGRTPDMSRTDPTINVAQASKAIYALNSAYSERVRSRAMLHAA